jgi:hypothetical protein
MEIRVWLTAGNISFGSVRRNYGDRSPVRSLPSRRLLMMFIRNFRKTDGSELEIQTAVREAISDAIIHGNQAVVG